MLRFLLLRFLPRRLLPILMVVEVVRLARRIIGGRNEPPPSTKPPL